MLLATCALRALLLFITITWICCQEDDDSEEDGPRKPKVELSDDQLREVHAEFDANGDKEATQQELMNFAERHQREVENAENGVDVGVIMKERDSSQDGLISLQEHLNGELREIYRVVGNTSADAQAARADETEKFHAADTNGDGVLNRTEHEALLHPATSERMVKVRTRHRLRDADSDHNGRLSLEEFQESSLYQEGGFGRKQANKISDADVAESELLEGDPEKHDDMDGQKEAIASKRLFKRLDKNGDGLIDHDELVPLESGRIQQEDAVSSFVQAFDKDGDLHIDAGELIQGKTSLHDADIQQYLIAWASRRKIVGR